MTWEFPKRAMPEKYSGEDLIAASKRTEREDHLDTTIELSHKIKDESENASITKETKLDLLKNIANGATDSALAELVAERFGFANFVSAMDQFGVFKNGRTVYVNDEAVAIDRYQNPPKPGSSWINRRVEDIKKGATASVFAFPITMIAYSALVAVGVLAAPVSIPAVLIGTIVSAGGAALGASAAKGIAELFTRSGLYKAERVEDAAKYPEGAEWQGSIAAKAANDMARFLYNAERLAQDALNSAETMTAESYNIKQIEEHKLRVLNDIMSSLDHAGMGEGEARVELFSNVAAFQTKLHKAESIEKKWGIVGALAGGIGANMALKPILVDYIAKNAIEHARSSGVWMSDGHLSTHAGVGHLVKHLNGNWHYQIDNTSYHSPLPNAQDAHGIVNAEHLNTLNNTGNSEIELVNRAQQHLQHYGSAVQDIAHDSAQSITDRVTNGPGFALTADTVQAAQDLHAEVFHVGVLNGVEQEVALKSVMDLWLGYIQTAGTVGVLPFAEWVVDAIGKSKRDKIQQGAQLSASRLLTNLPKPKYVTPVPPVSAVEAAKVPPVIDPVKVYNDFEKAYVKGAVGTFIQEGTTDLKLPKSELKGSIVAISGSPATYNELKNQMDAQVAALKGASTDVHRFVLLIPKDNIDAIQKEVVVKTVQELNAKLVKDLITPYEGTRDQTLIVPTSKKGEPKDNPSDSDAWTEHISQRAAKAKTLSKDVEFKKGILV